MTNPFTGKSEQRIELLIGALDSLREGDLAVEMLIGCGQAAVPRLADFLLNGAPRSLSLPRCRAARALGELGAYSTLISYFRQYTRPLDSQVLFAEDAVRSAAASELARHQSSKVLNVLLDAAWQRSTEGLIQAIGEFHRPESVPLLFKVLEDDFCRESAMRSLRKLPDSARQFGILSIRGLTNVTLEGPSAVCRRRATLRLLRELGVSRDEWPDLRRFLSDKDAGNVVSAAQVGLEVAPETEWPEIITALLKAAPKLNSLQEGDVEELLDAHLRVAREIALQMAKTRKDLGGKPDWLSPSWRILSHVLGKTLETEHQGEA